MEISSSTPLINPANLPIEQLAGNTHLSDKAKVGELSRQFEAVLLRQILSEAQKPVIKTRDSDTSTAGGIYRDMVTNQLADNISKSGTFGVAKSLNQQLTRQANEEKP